MSLENLVSKYIISADQVLKEMQVVDQPMKVNTQDIGKIIEYAKAYLDDARYYKQKEKLEVSLTSVAYCEGLLDALKLLGAVKFEWPTREKTRREK